MTATPPNVTDELFARLREYYDEAQLVELAAFNMVVLFNHLIGRPPFMAIELWAQ